MIYIYSFKKLHPQANIQKIEEAVFWVEERNGHSQKTTERNVKP